MAAPTITSLEPATGPTGGLTLVEVAGPSFRMPPAPSAMGPTSPPRPTVDVLVGGRAATLVRVRAPDRLSFVSPPHDAGAADVVVRNLDDDGVPVAGEEATLAGGFTFVAPRLAVESDLTRLVRSLLRELKRQVHPNVSLTVQTDFDAETGDELHLTELASMPGLVLVGPELTENRFYSLNQSPETVRTDGGRSGPARRYDASASPTGPSRGRIVATPVLARTTRSVPSRQSMSARRRPRTAPIPIP